MTRPLLEPLLPIRMPLSNAVSLSAIAHRIRFQAAFSLEISHDADCLLLRPAFALEKINGYLFFLAGQPFLEASVFLFSALHHVIVGVKNRGLRSGTAIDQGFFCLLAAEGCHKASNPFTDSALCCVWQHFINVFADTVARGRRRTHCKQRGGYAG